MFCADCGDAVSGTRFCGSCGADLEAQAIAIRDGEVEEATEEADHYEADALSTASEESEARDVIIEDVEGPLWDDSEDEHSGSIPDAADGDVTDVEQPLADTDIDSDSPELQTKVTLEQSPAADQLPDGRQAEQQPSDSAPQELVDALNAEIERQQSMIDHLLRQQDGWLDIISSYQAQVGEIRSKP